MTVIGELLARDPKWDIRADRDPGKGNTISPQFYVIKNVIARPSLIPVYTATL